MKNKRRGSDLQYSLCCVSATKGHPKYSSIVVCEVEESDSFGDETVEETFEVRQKHRRHVNNVLRCVTTRTEEDKRSNDWKSTQTLTGRVIK